MACRIVSFYSPKGGVGKSFIAANLAANLRLETKKDVLVLDFTLPFSTGVSHLLRVKNVRSFENILPTVEDMSALLLRSLIAVNEANVSLMSFSRGKSGASTYIPTAEQLRSFLRKIRSYFQYIIVDLGPEYDVIAESFFDVSDLVLLPVIPDHLAIEQTRAVLELLRDQNFPQEKIKTIINMDGLDSRITVALIEQLLGKASYGTIPYEKDASFQVMEGTFPERNPKHAITKALDLLTLKILRLPENKADFIETDTEAAALSFAEQVNSTEFYELKLIVHGKLLQVVDLKKIILENEGDAEEQAEQEIRIKNKIAEIIDTETSLADRAVRNELLRQVFQEAVSLGPLEDLLADKAVSEIMVNQHDLIYVEKNGKIIPVATSFSSEKYLRNIIDRIVAPLGRKIDTSSPMVDARLPDGSRVNAIIPPLAPYGSVLTIRKFPEERLTKESLLQFGTWSENICIFLETAVKAKLNVVVSGGTGTGKTTMLNILSSFIGHDERIITIEDSAELNLPQPHVITLESRQGNIEGKGEVTIRDLVRNSLRMRPDRIIIGECRGEEALDMLQAMNTGHDGSLTTIHANSTREAISRLETLVLYAGFELPVKAIKQQIAGSVDLLVQISRFRDGSRKVVQVTEISGMEGDVITTGDIFVYKQHGEADGRAVGSFQATGYLPECVKTIQEKGLSMPREIFWTSN